MTAESFADRVERLEFRVSALEKLPEQVAALTTRVEAVQSQVLQLRDEMHDGFSAIREQMATKDDLERFATKDDLERFATKDDLERFATKEDLERFATKEDLERFATKEDLERFATKEELAEGLVAVTTELGQQIIESRAESRALFEEVIRRIEGMKG
jgi:hypothetical protein